MLREWLFQPSWNRTLPYSSLFSITTMLAGFFTLRLYFIHAKSCCWQFQIPIYTFRSTIALFLWYHTDKCLLHNRLLLEKYLILNFSQLPKFKNVSSCWTSMTFFLDIIVLDIVYPHFMWVRRDALPFIISILTDFSSITLPTALIRLLL